MQHIQSRHQLIDWVATHCHDPGVVRAINHGHTILWGLFKGGYVVETEYGVATRYVGIHPYGVKQDFVCGLLFRIPWEHYIGGEDPISAGDFPKQALINRSQALDNPGRGHKDNSTDR